MEAESADRGSHYGVFRVVVSRYDGPAFFKGVVKAEGQSATRGSQCEFFRAGSPLASEYGQFDIDVDEHSFPLFVAGLFPDEDTSVVAGGDEFVVGCPVEVADCLGVVFDVLDEFPGVYIVEGGYFVEMDSMVLFAGNGAVVTFG